MTVGAGVSAPRHWTVHDPRLIRRVLAAADEIGTGRAAARAGLSPSTVCEWRRLRHCLGNWPNDYDIADWDRWEAAHAKNRRIVNASHKRRTLLRRHLSVDITGTRRRLQALFALGWRYQDLGDRLGVGKARVWSLVQGDQTRVYLATAAKVRALYDELSMTVPEGPTFDRQRRWAAKLGFAPPLAWDDEDLDDPAAQPRARVIAPAYGYDEAVVERFVAEAVRPEGRNLTHAEVVEAVRRLRRAGVSTHELRRRYRLKAERYNWKDEVA